jgi:hypothetical protein
MRILTFLDIVSRLLERVSKRLNRGDSLGTRIGFKIRTGMEASTGWEAVFGGSAGTPGGGGAGLRHDSGNCGAVRREYQLRGTRTAGMVPAGTGAAIPTVAASAGAAEKNGTAGGIARVSARQSKGGLRVAPLVFTVIARSKARFPPTVADPPPHPIYYQLVIRPRAFRSDASA